MIRLFLFVKLFIFFIFFLTFKAMALEEASYSIVYQNDVYEIRNYNERLVIEVNYNNSRSGFRKLFNYIAGSNINSTKINMTTPVNRSDKNGVKVMQFFLPSNFTKKNAPMPINKELTIITIEKGYYAVKKYSGRLSDKNFEKHRKILKDNLIKNNIKTLSNSIRSTYNGPLTLPFLRRNEVMFRVSWINK